MDGCGSRSGCSASPGWDLGMSSILVASAVTVAAFYVWLAVRIVNRRERWTKWTAAVLAVPTIYLLSMGPVLWMDLRGLTPTWAPDVPLYWPVQWIRENGPEPIRKAINDYLSIWGRL
jgi:hypothetical protein